MKQPAFSDDKPTDGSAEYQALFPSLPRLVAILVVGLSVILLVFLLQPAKQFGLGERHPGVGQVLDHLEVAPLVGDTASVTLETLRGDVVLLNFWGTWCPPCMMEFPHLVEMNDRLKTDPRFRFIAVSCGPGGSDVETEQLRAATEAYLATLDPELSVYCDPGGRARLRLMKTAGLSGFSFPTTVLLDGEGTIQGLWEGYRPGVEAEVEEAVRALLNS